MHVYSRLGKCFTQPFRGSLYLLGKHFYPKMVSVLVKDLLLYNAWLLLQSYFALQTVSWLLSRRGSKTLFSSAEVPDSFASWGVFYVFSNSYPPLWVWFPVVVESQRNMIQFGPHNITLSSIIGAYSIKTDWFPSYSSLKQSCGLCFMCFYLITSSWIAAGTGRTMQVKEIFTCLSLVSGLSDQLPCDVCWLTTSCWPRHCGRCS